MIGYITEVNAEVDEHGHPISGTGQRAFVELPLPPTINPNKNLSTHAIERAVKAAVYDENLKEYGNRNLVVLSFGDTFRFDFEEVKRTLLRPPGNK